MCICGNRSCEEVYFPGRRGKQAQDEQLRRRLLLKITSCQETTAAGDPSAKFDFAGFVIFSFCGFDQVGNLAETAQVDNL